MRPSSLSLFEAKALLSEKKLSPRELLTDLISAISERDGEIGAYLSYKQEAALNSADEADVSLPLGGLPVAIKDNINVLGEPCTCASKILLHHYSSPYDATVAARLKAAGAIPFGRTNMDEFAMGSSTENSALQQTRNPHGHNRVPGGSSGGSAAAVASGMALAALGSDTGGSIRQPASFCGITGLKPTYGRVSRYGLVAFASSLDQIGPMTRSARDAAMLLQAISGRDEMDSTSARQPVPDFLQGIDGGVKGLRIGLPREYSAVGTLHPAVKEATEKTLKRLQGLGAEIVDISLPHTEYGIATYYILATAEASSNLARFDGIRYGHRTENPREIMELHAKSRGEGFGPEVKRRILLGTYVLSSGYYNAYYLKAQKMRAVIRRDFETAFAKVDVIASPTTPAPAFKIGEKTEDPLQLYLADIFTIAANLAGLPAISVPCGITEEEGERLPLGFQLMAPHWQEATLLRAAKALEG